jgi:ribosomal protein S30
MMILKAGKVARNTVPAIAAMPQADHHVEPRRRDHEHREL